MARKGRKRKSVHRESNGRASRSRRPFASKASGGYHEISEEQADLFLRQWNNAWRALRQAGESEERAVFEAVIDPKAEDWQPPFWVEYSCIQGLIALCAHFRINVQGEDKEAPSQSPSRSRGAERTIQEGAF